MGHSSRRRQPRTLRGPYSPFFPCRVQPSQAVGFYPSCTVAAFLHAARGVLPYRVQAAYPLSIFVVPASSKLQPLPPENSVSVYPLSSPMLRPVTSLPCFQSSDYSSVSCALTSVLILAILALLTRTLWFRSPAPVTMKAQPLRRSATLRPFPITVAAS